MNNKHSEREWFYRPRFLSRQLRKAVEDHPVVILTGARQVGKSTLLGEEQPFATEDCGLDAPDELDVVLNARLEGDDAAGVDLEGLPRSELALHDRSAGVAEDEAVPGGAA